MRASILAAGVAAGAAVVAAMAWVALGPRGAAGAVAVLGDEAPSIRAAMGTEQALPLHTAALTIVAVQGWDRLSHIGDLAGHCGGACAGETGLARALLLGPRGTRKLVFVNLDAWPGTATGRGQETDKDFACLARALTAERAALAPDALPACAAEVATGGRTRLALPAGLGTI